VAKEDRSRNERSVRAAATPRSTRHSSLKPRRWDSRS
jgi:hypothetical protein